LVGWDVNLVLSEGNLFGFHEKIPTGFFIVMVALASRLGYRHPEGVIKIDIEWNRSING
jgi:hypothetical protein